MMNYNILNFNVETNLKRNYSDRLLRRLSKMNKDYRPLRIKRIKEFKVAKEGIVMHNTVLMTFTHA